LEHALATLAISLGGDDEQRARLLPDLASGRRRATIAVAEPGERWRTDAMAMGGSTLSGQKSWVLHADGADVMVVVLHDGLAVVEGDAGGVNIQPIDGLDRTRRFASVRFAGTGHERLGGGAVVAERVLDAASVLLAADAFGGAQRCLNAAVEYAKTRKQFGVTIGHFQAIKHQLADLALEVEPCRGLYWYAAHAFDHVPDDAARFASLAKAHVTDRYVTAMRRVIEVHGGIGYTWECDLHVYLRRSVFDRAYGGGPALHRERFAVLSAWGSDGKTGPSVDPRDVNSRLN
jgi:alkylation response protein AidB-like acyl-CoA dehydrogenase